MVFLDAPNSSDAPRIEGRRSPGRSTPRSILAMISSAMVSIQDRAAPFG
jgi:hypothetical protein